MRGGFQHNQVIIQPLAAVFAAQGAVVYLEHPIRPGHGPRFVDALAVMPPYRIAIEGECSARRIAADIVKAQTLQVDLLIIVVPNRRVSQRVKRQLQVLNPVGALRLLCLTLGAALQLVRNKSQLMSVLNVTPTLIPKIPTGHSPATYP